ncbi:metabotropic glutamate receptor 3 isoform X3 [Strongylocentrotus purpuratus]|uniref:G-protein coupled receptors family 3 profile domain-containing protein n=1 Tax=Strongylocentrotus purpuratus TaxID=7668 RepID=A0A7M7NL34_STRPU|nr:metabotropic glutamate receptor 3 isoform X3 [Strongylocentrotus purpuratus]
MDTKLFLVISITFCITFKDCHAIKLGSFSAESLSALRGDEGSFPQPYFPVSGAGANGQPVATHGSSSMYNGALEEYQSLFQTSPFIPHFAGTEPLFRFSSQNGRSVPRSRRTAGSTGNEEDTSASSLPESAKVFAQQDGDFVVGGTFAVNLPDGDILCGRLLEPAGLWVESMIYAVDVINNRTDILPNHKLGFDIRNDCSNQNRALTEALNFVENSQPSNQCPLSESQTIGVVGTGSSSTSIALATLLGLFSIPQVSYSATSQLLSDKQLYPYFLRTVPSDENQARVMADLADIMNWNYVAILYSANSYGGPGRKALYDNLKAKNACIALEYSLGSESAAAVPVKDIVANLKADPKIQVIFTFAGKTHITSVLQEAKEQGLTGRTWIASDSWGDSLTVVNDYLDIVSGMVGIVPKARIDPGLKRYIASLDPFTNSRNPWYQLTLGSRFGCTFDVPKDDTQEDTKNDTPFCHGNETFASMLESRGEGGWTSFIIDAVHSLAFSLHDMLYECKGSSCPGANASVLNTEDYFQYVKNVTFPGLTNPAFRFDENGDPLAQYYVNNLQVSDGVYDFMEVGSWDPLQKFTWSDDIVWSSEGVSPVSRCSADCPSGSYIVRESINCCWDCVRCEAGSISTAVNSESCRRCANGERTDADQTSCIVKPIQYLQWTDPFSIAISICAVLGFVAVVICFGTYVRYRHTPTIKATSTELSYILLTAITTTLVCIFLYLSKPTDLMCNLQISLLGCSFALYVATLLTKTNRISRIFNRKLSQGRPSMFLNIKYQVIFVMVIVLVQACLQVLLSQIFPPEAVYDYSPPEVTDLVCRNNILSSILAFIYNLLLALLCSFQAFRIRKLPGQFNDSRGICFSMLTFCLLAFIFIATTFATTGKMKAMISALSCLACAFSGILCMFVPKIWIVCFRPELNIRQSTLRLPALSTLNTITGTVNSDRGRARRNAVFILPSNGTPMNMTRSATLASRARGANTYNTDSDHDSGASSASDDEDTEAIDEFLEELARLERELRDAERVRDQAVTKADEMYAELQNVERQHRFELEQVNEDYEMEKTRMRETLIETGVEEEQLQQIEKGAQKGAKQAVNFVDFAEHLAQMNIERSQLRHQVDEITKECQHWKDQVLASTNITAEELDELGASGENGDLSNSRERSNTQIVEDEETSSKADSGVV